MIGKVRPIGNLQVMEVRVRDTHVLVRPFASRIHSFGTYNEECSVIDLVEVNLDRCGIMIPITLSNIFDRARYRIFLRVLIDSGSLHDGLPDLPIETNYASAQILPTTRSSIDFRHEIQEHSARQPVVAPVPALHVGSNVEQDFKRFESDSVRES